jgi:ADP-ribosylglycohydrolase
MVSIHPEVLIRAQGCLLGQLAGDSLGGLVEFQSAAQIRSSFPDGVRELAHGGVWRTLAGQPTDDSEMALSLARTLVARGTYHAEAAREAYVAWISSAPFDCGATTAGALSGHLNPDSQANGAMMRASPLGIFGANHPDSRIRGWADEDAGLTHPHPVCRQANALYVMAIAHAIRSGGTALALYRRILSWADEMGVDASLRAVVRRSAQAPPPDYLHQQGWILIAFGNALWQLLHAASLEEGVVDTVMRGGDTDTNAAICGALLGAVHGLEAIPGQWVAAVLDCRPDPARRDVLVHRPRPRCYWPTDALELAAALVSA